MHATVTVTADNALLGSSDSGHQVTMDMAPDLGGQNQGPRPMEMLLLGMGGCTLIDVMFILRKSRQAFSDCLLYTSPSPRDQRGSRMPSSA